MSQEAVVTTQSAPSFEQIQSLVAGDMAAVDAEIQRQLNSPVALINQLGAYIINSGGKRLRPMITVLAARACGFEGNQHQTLAAIIEFIHTATLLHDDVVDESDLRRGKETANNVWGNAASVLVGDFLYSRAFQMMITLDNMRVMEVLANTTNTIAEGEVLQLLNCGDPDTTEDRYMEVICNKTAKLFEAGTRLGAVLTNQPIEREEQLAEYGLQLGMAFQLVDDALDYNSSAEEMGKNVGDDLAEGKPTLPLIYAMQKGTEEQRQLIRHSIEKGDRGNLSAVLEAVQSTGALTYTAQRAEEAVVKAKASLANFPNTPQRQALLDLADLSISRRS